MTATLRGKRAAMGALVATAVLAAAGVWTASATDAASIASQDPAGADAVTFSDQNPDKFMDQLKNCLADNSVPESLSKGIVIEGPFPSGEDSQPPQKPTGAKPTQKEIKALEAALDKCAPAMGSGPFGPSSTGLDPEAEKNLQNCLADNGAPEAFTEGVIVAGPSTGEDAQQSPPAPTADELKALDRAFKQCESVLPGGPKGDSILLGDPQGQSGSSAILNEEQERELQACLAEAGVTFDNQGGSGFGVGSPDQMRAMDSCFQKTSGDAPATTGTGTGSN